MDPLVGVAMGFLVAVGVAVLVIVGGALVEAIVGRVRNRQPAEQPEHDEW
jgi:hypothetical protein